jgi:hypothetical protein
VSVSTARTRRQCPSIDPAAGRRPWGRIHTVEARARACTAPGRLVKQRNIIVSRCGSGERRKEAVVVPQAHLFSVFLELVDGANPGSQSPRAASQMARDSQTRKRLQLCFTRSRPRGRRATQTKESSATVTPLVCVPVCCTAPVVHSAPPVRYLQLMGDETHRLGRPHEPDNTMANVTRACRVPRLHRGRYACGRFRNFLFSW